MNILLKNHNQGALKSTICFFLILSLTSAYSQAPNLYSLKDYSVFTSVGAISNTGLTNINGNLGTNVGAFTGFPPGNISGSTHIADSSSALVAIDMDSVYAQISRLNCDTTIDSSLGANQVIFPGVNCITSAATLNGRLTFDGLNKTNAYFIIKINGAFNSASLSEVALYDSASSSNIFWLINGAVSLGDSSIFMGNIIGNGAISLLTHASLQGKALTRQGAISMLINTIDTTRQMNPLPIEVNDYDITIKENVVHLYWKYFTDTDEKITFNFEYSKNGCDWETISTCNNVQYPQYASYHLADLNPKSNYSYYRLSMFHEGVFTYMGTKTIYNKTEHQITIFPNPNQGKLTITNDNNEASDYTFKIFSSHGKLVHVSEVNEIECDLSSLKKGIYFVNFIFDGELVIKKLIVE